MKMELKFVDYKPKKSHANLIEGIKEILKHDIICSLKFPQTFDLVIHPLSDNVYTLGCATPNEIVLNSLSVIFDGRSSHNTINRLFGTVSHELVHVNQIYRGDLCSHPDHIIYKNKKYPIPNPSNFKEYINYPWEIEARDLTDYVYFTCFYRHIDTLLQNTIGN